MATSYKKKSTNVNPKAMFIKNDTDTLFEVMSKHDGSCDPEQRWKDLRAGVWEYNAEHGTGHGFDSELLNMYWDFLKANNQLVEPNYSYR